VFVSAALGIQHAMHKCHIIIGDISDSTIFVLNFISKSRIFGKEHTEFDVALTVHRR
jgi:hypothetical protein